MKCINLKTIPQSERVKALKEIQIVKMTQHPNIIRYIESFIDKGYLCIVMELCSQGDLKEFIDKHKKKGARFSEKLIMKLFVQLVLGLKHIHDKKILHRDIKTANIFINNEGQLKIGDFGISKVLETM